MLFSFLFKLVAFYFKLVAFFDRFHQRLRRLFGNATASFHDRDEIFPEWHFVVVNMEKPTLVFSQSCEVEFEFLIEHTYTESDSIVKVLHLLNQDLDCSILYIDKIDLLHTLLNDVRKRFDVEERNELSEELGTTSFIFDSFANDPVLDNH